MRILGTRITKTVIRQPGVAARSESSLDGYAGAFFHVADLTETYDINNCAVT